MGYHRCVSRRGSSIGALRVTAYGWAEATAHQMGAFSEAGNVWIHHCGRFEASSHDTSTSLELLCVAVAAYMQSLQTVVTVFVRPHKRTCQ